MAVTARTEIVEAKTVTKVRAHANARPGKQRKIAERISPILAGQERPLYRKCAECLAETVSQPGATTAPGRVKRKRY